ncbi:MAG: AMP-binding protein [Pseudomonadota bacterium]
MVPEIPGDTIYGRFVAAAQKFTNNTALLFLGTEYSYAQLREAVEGFAASLQDLGVKRDDKAVLYLSNSPQWIIAWLALMRLGAVPVPISPMYTPSDLRYMVNDSGAETIICMDTNYGYVEEVIPETDSKRVIVTTIVELLPLWKRLLGKAFDRVPQGKYSLGKDTYAFKKLLSKSPSTLPPYEGLNIKGESLAEILYTGGTSGFPKGVPFTHLNLLDGFTRQRSMSEAMIPKGEDVYIQAAPLFHILGQAMAFAGILSGDLCVLLPRMVVDGLLDHIQRYRAKTFFGVPSLYRIVLEHKRLDNYDLSSLKYCFSAGDVLPMEIANRWVNKYKIPISQGYGATETCGGVAMTYADERPPEGSVGKLLPGHRVKLVDPETLNPVQEGEPGELLVSTRCTVKSYWKKPEETAESFVEIDNDRWYRTKDIVRIDKEGWFYFSDRSADTIKHKGYRVAASEIESVLQENPAVISSCVVGIPDQSVGERIKAFVVLKEDIKGVTGYDLMKWCRERLAPYKVPQYIEFRDMLPKSKVGKLLRREVRSDERRKLEA